MADLNALIAQGYQFQPLPDPFVQYGKMQQLQQGQQANQLNQLNIQKTQRDFEEQNQLRGLDPTSPTYLSDVTKISPKLGLEFGNLRQEGENKKLEFKTKTTALLKNKIDMLPEAYARADTPEAYISLHESIHADPELGPWLKSIGATKEQGRAKINEAIQNGTFDQLRVGSMQSVADIKDQMGNAAYAKAQGAPALVGAAPAVVQQGESVGPIRESAPSSPLVTPQVSGEATNALAPPSVNAFAASPVDKFKDRIKAIDAEIAQGNSNPAFNKSTAWADAKKRLEEERKSLMLSADQQIRLTTPNPVQINVGDEILTIDQNPNSLTYNKETAPRRKMNLTAKQQLDKVTPNPQETRLGNQILTIDKNPNSPTYNQETAPRREIGLTAQQELAKTTPNPVDTRLGDRVVTKDMNPNSPTYGQVISQQTINQTLNEQYNQTAPKPVDTRLGDKVVTRDMNPGSPTYGQVISQQTIGFTAEQALNNTSPKPVQVNDGKRIYFIDNNANSPTYGKETGAPAVSVKMTPGQEANLKVSQARLNISQENLNLAKKRFSEEMAGPAFKPETIDMMAQMYLQTGVLPPIGQGKKGAEAKALILNRANEISMGTPGATAESAAANIVGNKSELAGTTAGQRTLGTQIANIQIAANETTKMISVAKPYVTKVNPTDYPAINAAGNFVARNTGDPNIVGLATSLNAIVNTYARAINPRGVATVSDKNHAREILNAAMSKGQLNEAFSVMEQEMAAALASGPEVRAAMRPGAAAAPAAGGFKYLGKE